MTPVGNSLLTSLYLTFALQFLSYLISAPLRTEKFYDASGAITFVTCTLVALLWRREAGDSIGALSARQIVAATCVCVWTVRLGGFLAWRASRMEDKRFDAYKHHPGKFIIVWAMQAVWVYLTALPVFIVLGTPAADQPAFAALDGVGTVVYAYGLGVEITADVQKQLFKLRHPKEFVRVGIWRWSRYANYYGECVLWAGVFLLCVRGFVEQWMWVGVIGPVFVVALVVGVSGVRLSEKGAEERYGGRADYQEYKATTSTFFLWPPRRVEKAGEVQPEPV
ncbi:uncharacterized protein EV422DRAFT_429754 [Fimicolochytrium jonesii]|uniref:uncharacterized protein n=1 Tax=Fimicolochytrium jonesii TaxID=1396493 RepID=UPI0022FE5E0E|nr:uncharacterized protein EV422DRAFT_429754 [Fimicolochytrium jonesii]KAI8821730.1 hypothetical protein EV422DRAFT_429754 [Fimicolochytrium jonesii]